MDTTTFKQSVHHDYNTNIFIKLTNVGSYLYIKNQNTGLGNMMFQISSALAYAIHHKANLHIIGIDEYISKEEITVENHLIRNIYHKPNYDLFNLIRNNTVGCHNNKENIFNHPFYDNILFEHYYENYDNFDKIKNVILDCFSPTANDIEYIINKYPVLLEDDLCSIHIRLGPDMMSSPEHAKERELNYIRGLEHMIQHKNIKKCFVFTNDKENARNILSQFHEITFYYSDERDYVDIWMISLIKNNIVSFSTLSWWGSYLNKCPNPYIVCLKGFRDDLHYPGWVVV